MSRIPLTPDELTARAEQIENEAQDAVHTAMLKWVGQKSEETGVPVPLAVVAAGKGLVIQGYMMMTAGGKLSSERGQALCNEAMEKLGQAIELGGQ